MMYASLKGNKRTILVFIGNWVNSVQITSYMLDDYTWVGQGAIEFAGDLFWMDMNRGLIVCDDPFGGLENGNKDSPECRSLPLPNEGVKKSPGSNHVVVGGDYIRSVLGNVWKGRVCRV